MFAIPLAFWAQTTLIAVEPGALDGCPSSNQIDEALRLRVPGAVVAADRAAVAGALRVRLNPPVAGLSSGFAVVGPKGEIRLRRPLRPAEAGRAGECLALAETVALILERYLQEIAVAQVSPPLVEQAPWNVTGRWRAMTAFGWWSGESGAGAWTLRGSGVRVLNREAWLIEGGVAVTGVKDADLVGGAAAIRHVSVDLVGYRRFQLAGGEVQVGAGARGAVLMIAGRVDGGLTRELRFSPGILAVSGFVYPVTRHVFLRLGARVGLESVRIVAGQKNQPAAFSTKRYHVGLEIGAGAAF